MKPGINLTLGALMLVVVFGISTAALFGAAQLVDTEDTSVEAGGEDGSGPGGVPGGPVSARVVAKDLKFDRRSITASPGVPVTVTLDNQDAGVPHNIAFYNNSQVSRRIAGLELFPGVAARELRFDAPSAPGNYFYRCDVHPDTMTGTFAVR